MPPEAVAAAAVSYVGSPWALLPALTAIVLALFSRQVLIALSGGIYIGALLLSGGALDAAARTLELIVASAADPDKVKIVLFTLLMGGLVGVITAAGGTAGLVSLLSRLVRTPRSGALATWGLGLLVFFDDYASTLLVGNTMRPLTDQQRISREKLSYIVDSTAAPIASLALVSTWIGYEVSVLGEALRAAHLPAESYDAYHIFLAGLPARFYPLYALAFVFLLAWFERDFGPMWKAEHRARSTGALLRVGASPLMDDQVLHDQRRLATTTPRASLAIIPIFVLILTVVAYLAQRGPDASYDALLYGAAAGLGSAVVLALLGRGLSLHGAVEACVSGFRAMTLAVLVLVLAWTIGKVMGDLKAGEFVAASLRGALPAWSLPTVTFVIAGLMALATGTSWGTMAILFPILLPVVAEQRADPDFWELLVGSTSAVLAGAVFGDHCSPISDTTVLSSIASASDHVDHTRTQAPYALFVAAVAIVFGTLPLGLGASPGWLLPSGFLALGLGARYLGRPVNSGEV